MLWMITFTDEIVWKLSVSSQQSVGLWQKVIDFTIFCGVPFFFLHCDCNALHPGPLYKLVRKEFRLFLYTRNALGAGELRRSPVMQIRNSSVRVRLLREFLILSSIEFSSIKSCKLLWKASCQIQHATQLQGLVKCSFPRCPWIGTFQQVQFTQLFWLYIQIYEHQIKIHFKFNHKNLLKI